MIFVLSGCSRYVTDQRQYGMTSPVIRDNVTHIDTVCIDSPAVRIGYNGCVKMVTFKTKRGAREY